MKLSLSFSQRIILLFALFVLGAMLTGGIQMLLGALSDNRLAVTRITVVCQDLLVFVLPALITALLLTRLPADLLGLRSFPRWLPMLGWLGATLVAQPVVEGLNYLCQQLPWPDAVLQLEAAANESIVALLGAPTAMNIIISLLILSLLTGLSEELFFRGALQNIFRTRPMSTHLAVWLTAIIFSLMHFQPVGFIPRLLLGALFGYASVRTNSTWTAVCCHILNNALALFQLVISN